MPKKAKPRPCYDYPRPALTADIILITREVRPRVLLVQRKHEPFAGCWALPGGFVDENENPDETAARELEEETSITGVKLKQFHAFGAPGRDPRGWTVTIAYVGRVSRNQVKAVAGDDAATVAWHSLHKLPPLAFDHAKILALARRQLKSDY